MLNQLSQLSEAKKETEKGVIHKADPGGYGRKFDTDEEGDEKDDKKKAAPAEKRGRGRPKKLGGDADTAAKYGGAKDLQSYIVGNLPKGKLPGKASKKNTLKDWVEQVEAKYVAEGVPPGMKPLAVMDPQNKQAGAGVLSSTNPAVQKMLGGIDPKDVKVVMTQPAAGSTTTQPAQQTTQATPTTTPAPAGSTGQAPAGQAQVKEKWGKPTQVSPEEKGKYAGKSKEELLKSYNALKKTGPHKKGSPEFGRMRELAFAIRAKGGWGKVQDVAEGDIPSDQNDMGAGLGAGRSQKTLEGKKPDFPDIDNDKNTTEPISKAAKDATKKKKMNESSHRHSAARLLGKAHALAKEAYNCRYDDMDEVRMYHEGYKEGLDECYGQGVYEEAPATLPGMADQAAGMEEGNAFTAALAKTPKGGKFSVGGKSFTDRSGYDASLGEAMNQGRYKEGDKVNFDGAKGTIKGFTSRDGEQWAFIDWDYKPGPKLNPLWGPNTVPVHWLNPDKSGTQNFPKSLGGGYTDSTKLSFESLDKQLSALLESETVEEGMTVSISKGHQGAPDSVSVTAQDGEADQLLGLIKQAGLGLFGDEQSNGYGAPQGSDLTQQHDGIDVIGDNDGMMALIKKVTGADVGPEQDGQDYADEEGHEEVCDGCGSSECQCDHEEGSEQEVDEVESYNQEEEEVSEENLPDSDAEETTADENAEAEEDEAVAQSDEEQVTEWANDAGAKAKDFDDESFDTDMEFMTRVISSGLNKEKSTGQTTVPVIAGQTDRMVAKESISDWKKLAGLK